MSSDGNSDFFFAARARSSAGSSSCSGRRAGCSQPETFSAGAAGPEDAVTKLGGGTGSASQVGITGGRVALPERVQVAPRTFPTSVEERLLACSRRRTGSAAMERLAEPDVARPRRRPTTRPNRRFRPVCAASGIERSCWSFDPGPCGKRGSPRRAKSTRARGRWPASRGGRVSSTTAGFAVSTRPQTGQRIQPGDPGDPHQERGKQSVRRAHYTVWSGSADGRGCNGSGDRISRFTRRSKSLPFPCRGCGSSPGRRGVPSASHPGARLPCASSRGTSSGSIWFRFSSPVWRRHVPFPRWTPCSSTSISCSTANPVWAGFPRCSSSRFLWRCCPCPAPCW